MGCSSLCRWDAVAECRFVQQVQNTFPDQEQWISICCPVVHAVAEPHSSCSGQQPRKAQAELAHLSRVMTMRELSASIAHEVKRPLAAIGQQWTMGASDGSAATSQTSARARRCRAQHPRQQPCAAGVPARGRGLPGLKVDPGRGRKATASSARPNPSVREPVRTRRRPRVGRKT